MTDIAPDSAIKPAATILLLRDQPEFEVLMVKRHHQIDFASGALVFPGGKSHERDHAATWDQYTLGFDAFGNRRRQAVTIHHPIGHHKVHPLRAQQAQAAQGHGASGGAIAVVIGHDAQGRLALDGVGQQTCRRLNAHEVLQGQQMRQIGVEVLRSMHATRCEQARQQGVHARLLQRPQAAGGDVALCEFHRSNKACSKGGERHVRHHCGQALGSH
jgi:hypothetical protein